MIASSTVQAWKNIREHATAAVSGIATTCISLVILGSVMLLYQNVIGLTQHFFQQNNYSVFIDKSTDRIVRERIVRQIESLPGVHGLNIVLADQVKEDLINSFGESGKLLEKIELPEFPDIIEFSIEGSTGVDVYAVESLESLDGVNEVVTGVETKEQVEIFFTITEFVGLFLISLMVISIVFIIFSAIQIAIRMRMEEIEILRILGATSSYIRLPFVIEGVFIGLFGYIISLGIIYFIYKFVVAGITFNKATYGIRNMVSFFSPGQMLVILLFIVVLGILSSLLATHKVFQELKT